MCASRRCASRLPLIVSIVGLSAIALSATGCGTHASRNPASQGAGSASSATSNSSATVTIAGGANLGMLWDSEDKTLRPIIGVPGSSLLGASVITAGNYTSAAYSAASGVALLTDSHGDLSLIDSTSQQPQILSQGAPSKADIAFSPDGQRATVFAPGTGSALLVSSLPEQAGVSSFSFGGTIQAMAVSDSGALLIASPGSSGVSITEVSTNGSRSTPASLAGFGGMTFLPGSDDFLLADSVKNTLVRFHSGTVQTLATHADGLNQPLAVATSVDGRWAVTANSSDGVLVRVSLTGNASPTRALCACSPSELTPLAGDAVFELTQPGSSPAWMIDAGRSTPSVFFIPPRHSSTTGGVQ